MPLVLRRRFLLPMSVLLAATSLIVNRSPAYDVWTWLLWGREIAHGDLVTSFGPQFKPLPVFVTTLLSPLGDWAIPLWMLIARVAGLLAIGAAARLAWRVAGPVAAAIAALGLVSLHQFTSYLLAYGMSEPMLLALAFWAIDRALSGHRATASILLAGACLLRPEAWPFLLGYAILLLRRRQARPLLLSGLLLLVPAAWFLPEWWGSGHPFRTGDGRVLPGGPLTSGDPGLAVLADTFDGFLTWVWMGALLGIGWAVWTRDRLTLWLVAAAAGWLAIVAVLTELGKSSGVTRYIIVTQAILCVVCGIGWVQAVRTVRSRLPALRKRLRFVLPLVVFLLAIPSAITAQRWIREGTADVRYQEGAFESTAAVIHDSDAAELERCGRFAWSAPYREPELAFRLHKHLYYVRSEFTPDLPDSARSGPLIQISLKTGSRLSPGLFKEIDYRPAVQARTKGVTAVLHAVC